MTTLLLLHGLGANRGVWTELLDELEWPDKVLTPDLPGHGGAHASNDYTMGALAAGVAASCGNEEEVIIAGHSLGGCVAICLASGFFRPNVVSVVSVGAKVTWSTADVDGMAKVAAKGIRWFETREQAAERFLRQSGLVGLVDTSHPSVEIGIAKVDGRWRVAQDPKAFAQRPVDMAGLMAAARCPVVLGAGENDAMVSRADLAEFTSDPRIAAAAGHNAQVESPAWFADLIREAAVVD